MSTFTEEQTQKFQKEYPALFTHGMRTPVWRRPDEYGMKYQDITFPSSDGVILEGWFIPKEGSNKIIICNHFLPGNRAGFPGHLPQYSGFGGFEVNFLPHYKALHDAGYNIVCYDIRNHGLSSDANGHIIGIGLLEYRDVIGSIQYVKSRSDLQNMEIGLLSICLGANSTIIAMEKHPEVFKGIKAMVALQPISIEAFVRRAAEEEKVDVKEALRLADEGIKFESGFSLFEMSPKAAAKSVTIPTKVMQLKSDNLTKISDVQEIYDNLGSKEKDIYWIPGNEVRFYAYNFLGKEPKHMLDWFSKYL